MNPYTSLRDVLTEIEPPEKGMLSHTLFNDDNMKIILFGFAPGHELTAHTAPMPATLHFLQGEATVTLGTESHEVEAGALIHMQPQLTHGIVAKTPVTMLLYLSRPLASSSFTDFVVSCLRPDHRLRSTCLAKPPMCYLSLSRLAVRFRRPWEAFDSLQRADCPLNSGNNASIAAATRAGAVKRDLDFAALDGIENLRRRPIGIHGQRRAASRRC